MRMSILNTATTEQMGYGIVSFFVYTKSTNSYLPFIFVELSAAEVEVRLIRTDIMQEKEQRLGLRLLANEYFSLAFPEWDALIGSHRTGPVYEHFDASLHTLRIANFMVEPKVWVGTAVSPYNGGYESGNWGAFSRKKPVFCHCSIGSDRWT